jgi:predicted unusual protein kinase regulating ubiquinone biosynthesis (AarF/ABC1/UbiB family)
LILILLLLLLLGNLGVEIIPALHEPAEIVPTVKQPKNKYRLVMYDFGQAASLTMGQADGILDIIEAIIDTDVDRSIEAFQKMGVLIDGADLDQVRAKVAENYRTGKVKANRKKLRRKGYKFQDETNGEISKKDEDYLDAGKTAASASPTGNDSQVMSYFSLPAEYAFVARAISQMDGVGKSLDPEFDFISSAAPYLVEIKGADLYLKDEVMKFIRGIQHRVVKFQMVTLPNWWEERAKE